MTPRDLDRAAARIHRHQRRTERQRKRVLLAVVDADAAYQLFVNEEFAKTGRIEIHMPPGYEHSWGLMTRTEFYESEGLELREMCGFRLDYPTGEPRFICTASPHPEHSEMHSDWLGAARYDQASGELRRGTHSGRES